VRVVVFLQLQIQNEDLLAHLGDFNSYLVDRLIRHHIIAYGNNIYIFNGSYYQRDDAELKCLIERCDRSVSRKYSESQYNVIHNLLVARCNIDPALINANECYIPFKNGYYNVKTGILEPSTYTEYYTYCIQFDYTSTAQCPKFITYLEQVLPDKTYRDRLCIFLATCFTSSIDLQKALMLYGAGGNGKSVIIDTIRYIFANVSTNIQLKNIGDRFNQILFMNNLINYYDDISHEDLATDSYIKTMTGSDHLSGEYKGLNDRITYKNTIHAIFTCNQVPAPLFNVSEAFWDRWVIIPFLQRFRGTERQNPNLTRELQQEAEGIIAYLLTFLPRKTELRRIKNEETRRLWLLYGESVYSFYEQCEKNDDFYVKTTELFNKYQIFCSNLKISQATYDKFGKTMSKLGISKMPHIIANYPTPQMCYIGIDYITEDTI
jgi:putative DNA primase/helicase